MYEISMDELHQLWMEFRKAAKYAREHYEDFATRKHTYTLYGDVGYALGVEIPSNFTPQKARKLSTKTRRKNYTMYELDDAFRVLRTAYIVKYTEFDCIYHHFDWNGTSYAYPFRGNGKQLYTDEIAVLKKSDEKPTMFACASKPLLFVQFYEYLENGKMNVSTYRYWPTAKITEHGYPVDRNAPLDALNCPVSRHETVETPEFVDFAKWLA